MTHSLPKSKLCFPRTVSLVGGLLICAALRVSHAQPAPGEDSLQADTLITAFVDRSLARLPASPSRSELQSSVNRVRNDEAARQELRQQVEEFLGSGPDRGRRLAEVLSSIQGDLRPSPEGALRLEPPAEVSAGIWPFCRWVGGCKGPVEAATVQAGRVVSEFVDLLLQSQPGGGLTDPFLRSLSRLRTEPLLRDKFHHQLQERIGTGPDRERKLAELLAQLQGDLAPERVAALKRNQARADLLRKPPQRSSLPSSVKRLPSPGLPDRPLRPSLSSNADGSPAPTTPKKSGPAITIQRPPWPLCIISGDC